MLVTCKQCGVQFLGSCKSKYCPMCARERKLESRRRERRWYKENGWCYDCGKKAVEGKTRCAECLEKVRKGWHERQRKKA